jgi:hypothetical protein
LMIGKSIFQFHGLVLVSDYFKLKKTTTNECCLIFSMYRTSWLPFLTEKKKIIEKDKVVELYLKNSCSFLCSLLLSLDNIAELYHI